MVDQSNHPDRFAWLLGTHIESQPDTPDSCEFARACEFGLAEWQILPAIGASLLSWGGQSHAREPAAQSIRDRILSLDVLGRIQLRLITRLIEAFRERQIPYSMLKGSAVRFSAYSDPGQRMGKDFDIGVPRRWVRQAERAARDCGFLPAQWNPSRKRFYSADPVLRARVEEQHYELGFLVRRQVASGLTDHEVASIRRDLDSQFIWHLTDDDELACYVSIDIHHGLSLEIMVDSLVDKASPVQWNGMAIQLPPAEWILFHLIYKIYWEGVHNYRKGVYQFADLVRLLPASADTTIARLLQILSDRRLEAAGYFVLRRLKDNFGLSLQPRIEGFLEAASRAPTDREPLDVNDLGDMWPKLWGAR